MAVNGNPIVEYFALSLAEQALKFQILIPSGFGRAIKKIAVINNEVLDLHLDNGLSYRMARGTEDISGVYQNFSDVSESKIEPYTVSVKGCYGKVFVATWTDGNFTFSFHTPYGIQFDEIKKIVASLCPTNEAAPPSPMVRYDFVFDAEYAAGFAIPVPACIHDKASKEIYVIGGKVAEIVYNGDLVYRVAEGVADISGIYQEFPEKEGFQAGRYHVLARGNKDQYYVTIWNDGKHSYSLHAPHGVSRKELEEFIGSLLQIN